MLSLNNLDVFFLSWELNDTLAHGYFNKIYDLTKTSFRIKMHKKGEYNLLVNLPGLVFLSNALPNTEVDKPSNFTMYLRKKLYNARLIEVRQLQFDRIIEFEFEAVGKKTFLIIELFAEGNIILLDDKRIILSSMKR